MQALASEVSGRHALSPIPIQISSVATQIAILSPEFSALTPRRTIISIIQIAAKFPPVMSNPNLVMTYVSPLAPPIVRKRRPSAHSDQQQYSRNRPLHILVLLRIQRILWNANPVIRPELR
jgi:hypothetical protein